MPWYTHTLMIVTCAVVIIVAGVWLSKNVSYGCIDLGFIKHCGATVTR